MTITINTNISASVAQAAMTRNSRELDTAMEKLSTGKKINSAADNASGLAITTRMTSQIQGAAAAISNASDAINMVRIADAALIEIESMLQRMRELTLQAASGTVTATDRIYLDAEYQNMLQGIDQIVENTDYNGIALLNNDVAKADRLITFQIGVNASQTKTYFPGVFVDDGSRSNVGAIYQKAPNILSSTLHTGVSSSYAADNFQAALKAIDGALLTVERQYAENGSFINTITRTVDNLFNTQVNTEAARSRIMDSNYARETSNLARTQIVQQAGMAMIAQANALPKTVMMLLSD